jgi:DNA-binding response OmpR family regulator
MATTAGGPAREARPASRLRRWPRLGPYRLMRRLGAGAFADVYAAVRPGDSTPLAVKVIPPGPRATDTLRHRLLTEGHLALGIDHPNLVRYVDVGEEDGAVYVVQELVDGGDAATLYDTHGGNVPPALITAIGRDAALGLAVLHRHGLVHRDVKPANLLMTRDGRCKVADLGLARPNGEETHVTSPGHVVGTPDFIAPEQVRDDPNLDHRADIYGLAASLYWMATGRSPHESPNMWTMLTRTISEPFPDPQRLRPDLPNHLGLVIRRAGDKDPARRHPSAEALADDLGDILAAREPRHASVAACVPPAATPCGGPVALLIDDDPLVRRMYAGRLVVDGWRIETAGDGDEACAAVSRNPPAVIVLDLMLATEPGTLVLRRLRALPGMAQVPVVVFTGLAGGVGPPLARELGVARVVGKAATSPRELSLLLRRIIETHDDEPPTGMVAALPAAGLARAALERLVPAVQEFTGSSLTRALDELTVAARGLACLAAGSGLGAARALAEAVEVQARHLVQPGASVGAQARRCLGLAADALVQVLAEAPPGPAWPPGEVLVVDADPLARRLVAMAFGRARLITIAAEQQAEADELLATHPVMLVVVDPIALPDPTAWLARLHVPLVVAGGHRDLPDHLRVEHLRKPWHAAELAALGLALLAGRNS